MRSICIRLVLVASTSVIAALSVLSTSANPTAGRAPFRRPELVLESTAGDGPGQFGVLLAHEGGGWWWPIDFAVDKDGCIWIVDVVNRRLQKYSPDGNFLLQFGGRSESSLITGMCRYIEAAPGGEIVIGPIDGDKQSLLAVLSSEGQLLRTLALPGPPVDNLDFGINAAGEIVYDVEHAPEPTTFAMDLYGKVLYTLTQGPVLTGRNVSPYSPVVLTQRFGTHPENVFVRYTGDLRDQKKEEVAFTSQGPPGSPDAGWILWYQADRSGNMFVQTRMKGEMRVEKMSFHAPDGRYIQTLPDCPKRSHRGSRVRFTLDASGDLYEMETFPPEGVVITPSRPIKGGEPFLRIWKWQRQDGADSG